MNNPVDACQSSAWHDAVKRDPSLWDAHTVYRGMQEDGEGGYLRLLNCVRCHSTIAVQE